MEHSNNCRDMLVRLYDLPKIHPLVEKLTQDGVNIRRAHVPERHLVVDWVRTTFGKSWADEFDITFAKHPVSCFIATKAGRIIGASVYNATALGTAGPIGLDQEARGGGIGKALLSEMLHDMQRQGYAYAVVGWVSPETQSFFKKAVNAEVIERSAPAQGIYKGWLEKL